MVSDDDKAKGFEFPCDYEIKVMGLNDEHFNEVVLTILNRHCTEQPLTVEQMRHKVSRNGKYVSVSVVIQARSMAHLDAIYAEMSEHEAVLARL